MDEQRDQAFRGALKINSDGNKEIHIIRPISRQTHDLDLSESEVKKSNSRITLIAKYFKPLLLHYIDFTFTNRFISKENLINTLTLLNY